MDSYGRKIITVTSTGTFLSVVNTSSLLIAIPTILLDLNISFLLAIWVIVAYSLALTVLTPILGKYSDSVGRKRLYSLGYLVFLFGSVVSTLAPDGATLLAGRLIQGIGGAFLFSNSLAIVTDTFKSLELRKAMGINAAVMAFGISIGPLIGGLLTDLTWRAIFIFNIPITLGGFLLSERYIREIAPGRKRDIDRKGAILLSLSIVFLVAFLTMLPHTGNVSALPYYLGTTAAVFFILFIMEVRKSPSPIINPGILRNPVMSVATLALFFGSLSRFSILFVMTLVFQGPLHYSPLFTGMLLIPLAGSMGVFSFLAGLMKKKVPDTILEITGLAVSGIGSIILGLFVIDHASYLSLAAAMVMAGAGNGLFSPPNSTIIMLSVPANSRGETAGIRALMINLGSVIGLTAVFMLISTYIPASVVGSIFLGVGTGGIDSYTSLFYLASEIMLFISGIVSLIPVPLILIRKKETEDVV